MLTPRESDAVRYRHAYDRTGVPAAPPPLRALTLRRPWPSAVFLPDPCAWSDEDPALHGIGAPEGGYGFDDREVAIGPKRIENRTQLPPRNLVGDWLAIHAGLGYDEVEWPAGLPVPDESECPTGIVGVVRVLGALDRRWGRTGRRRAVVMHDEDDLELRLRLLALDREDWWWTGPVGWLLDDAIAIEPVACRGAQGVWPVPKEIAAEVRRRVEKARGATA